MKLLAATIALLTSTMLLAPTIGTTSVAELPVAATLA